MKEEIYLQLIKETGSKRLVMNSVKTKYRNASAAQESLTTWLLMSVFDGVRELKYGVYYP